MIEAKLATRNQVRIASGKSLPHEGLTRKTRRTDPARVKRHCPVLAAATLLTLAAGSRVEDAQALKKSPSALPSPPKARIALAWLR